MLIVVLFGIALAAVGFTMAFRQATVRRLFGRSPGLQSRDARSPDEQDPLTYVLRIAGVMIMIFGIVIAGMVTLFHFA